MIVFREMSDSDPALVYSPMVRAIEKTFGFIAERGPIGVTASKALKRYFVHWAAAEFEWPGYSERELFSLNKVLNEVDFPPLMDMHDLLIALKIGRHYKGRFQLTPAGRSLAGRPGRLFGIVTPFYLFEVDHARFARVRTRLLGNWDIFLNVLNVEAEDGVSGAEICRKLYGAPETERGFSEALSSLYVQVLRPLCWTGLLLEQRVGGVSAAGSVFSKTPLWRTVLQLDTDDRVKPAVRH